jgi:hypothetical protein
MKASLSLIGYKIALPKYGVDDKIWRAWSVHSSKLHFISSVPNALYID